MRGSTPAATMSRNGPAYLLISPSDPDSSALLVEPASLLSPWGVMARSSAPPDPLDVAHASPTHEAVEQHDRDDDEGDGVNDLARPLAGRGEVPLGQGGGDAHEEADADRDGQAAHLAAMTAANAAAISTVKLLGSSPMMGAASTPVNPAKKTLTAHTPPDTRSGFVPDRSVMAGESTMARTLRPTSVKRRTPAPSTTVATTQM